MAAKKTRLVLRDPKHFSDEIALTGLSIAKFAEQAQVARETIHALINPAIHENRKGGMYRATAWRIARAYTEAFNEVAPKHGSASITPEEAFDRLFTEVETD